MTRSVLYGVVLVSAVAGAALWAASPGCESRFCFGTAAKTEALQDKAQSSEIPGTGRKALDTTVQEPIPTAASDHRISTEEAADPRGDAEPLEETSEVAEPPEDWREQQTSSARRAAYDDGDGAIDAFEEPELSHKQRKARAKAAAKAEKQWQSLAEAALNEPDDELRGAAINSVGLHRSAESVGVLNEVAVFDPAPDNRLQAVQQLWYSAADGLDKDGMIRSTLKTALDDPDEAIADMAEKALADLQALEEARDEAQQFN